MIGSDGVVEEAVPVPNSYTGPQEDFFVIDPKDLHRVDRESREKGLDVLGVFIPIRIATPIFRSAT